MAHLFLSYSSKNVDFVRYLRMLLEQRGLPVWVDEAQLSSGTRWWRQIEKNIEACAALIVVMSPDSRESDWVERELLLAEKLRKPIFPVLYAGEVWPRLANIHCEDLRAGLSAQLSPRLIANLERFFQAAHSTINLSLAAGDITTIEADVIALKYAQSFHGADRAVADLLRQNDRIDIRALNVEPGDYYLGTGGVIGATQVMYVGTRSLRYFDYQDVQDLARNTLEILAERAPDTTHLAMTIHGPGSGLDETQALIAQFNGYLSAFENKTYPLALERITIVERNPQRLTRLQAALTERLNSLDYVTRGDDGWRYDLKQASETVVQALPERPHAYVILADGPDDAFYYGIQQPTHASGLLCEPVPPQVLEDPDLLQKAQQQISTATVVVADLTDATAAVHVLLGYAWGRERPVILIAEADATLSLDAPDCLRYESIHHLESQLFASLVVIRTQGEL